MKPKPKPSDKFKDLKELIQFAKTLGISTFKHGDIEFTFSQVQASTIPEPEVIDAVQTEIPIVGERMPPDDVMMFMSSDNPLLEVKEP